MKYNPIHPHCGPFNSISKKKPKNKVDQICWKHDKEYSKLPWYSRYIGWNKADEDFYEEMGHQGATGEFYRKALLFGKPFGNIARTGQMFGNTWRLAKQLMFEQYDEPPRSGDVKRAKIENGGINRQQDERDKFNEERRKRSRQLWDQRDQEIIDILDGKRIKLRKHGPKGGGLWKNGRWIRQRRLYNFRGKSKKRHYRK